MRHENSEFERDPNVTGTPVSGPSPTSPRWPKMDIDAIELQIVANPTRSTLMDYTRRVRTGDHIAPAVLEELTAAARRILYDPTSYDRLKRRAREFLTACGGPNHGEVRP